MKKLVLLSLLFVISIIYSAAQNSDEKQILKLEDDWIQALKTKDRQLLDRIVAPEFSFIEPNGTVLSRSEYLTDRASNSAEIESFESSDMQVRVYGNSAVASGLAKITERRQGQRYSFSLRWKELWLKDSGKWQVVAGQATPVNAMWDKPFAIK